MSVRIISDSGCDMTQLEAQIKDVIILPLKTIIDGKEYLDGITISPEQFYEKLEECTQLPSTSQVTYMDFATAYDQVAADDNEAVVITVAGALSGTLNSAILALEDYRDRIHIVDSGSVCIGQRILLEYALRLREQGLSAAAIAAELEQMKPRICVIARLDTLEYLMRGGRISRTAGITGTMLGIKPVLGIENGEIKMLGKARGSKKSNNILNEIVREKGGIDFSLPYMLAYSGTDDALLKGYIENSRELWSHYTSELPISIVGSTIGTHAGPGAIAVAFFAPVSAGQS